MSQLSLALNRRIGNGLLPPCQHKRLEAGNLGLLPLGTINTHPVSFHWIRGVVTINTYLTI